MIRLMHLSTMIYQESEILKVVCLECRYTCSSDFIPPQAVGTQQPASIDPTLDLCTRYPLWLGGPRKCGIHRLPNTSTHGQHWESHPRPSDLESNALSTWPHVIAKKRGECKVANGWGVVYNAITFTSIE